MITKFNFDLSFTSSQMLLSYVAIILLIIAVIILARKYKPEWMSLTWRTGTAWRFGLFFALLLTLPSFNWTSDPVVLKEFTVEPLIDIDIEVDPPITRQDPPPPTPPPPVIEEVPEEEILEDDEPEFIDQDIEEDVYIDEPEVEIEKEVLPPPPPPPSPPIPVVEEIFKVVESMPRFPGCENEPGNNKTKEDCAKQKMLQYIYKNVEYPSVCRENGIEGMVVIQFVIAKDGSVEGAKIVRDIGGNCGLAALKVVKAMNKLPQKWTPGRQRGKAVKVLYTLPVRFKLEE